MGSELVDSDLPEDNKKKTYSEIFWEAYPAYLTMGMSSDEYWNGDAVACRAYRKKREEELKLQDEMLWRQGLYIYHALCCVAPYFNSIKPQKPQEYIKPFSYTQEQEKKSTLSKKDRDFKAVVEAWAATVNANRAKNGTTT